MGAFIDLEGERSGKLLVLKRCGIGSGGAVKWLCHCDCGNKTEVLGRNLRSGTTSHFTQSCGCLIIEKTTTHGQYKSGTYSSWSAMKERCYRKKHNHYKDYGGRGIKVCKRWLGKNGFTKFLKDMGERPKGYTLERIDNNDNYFKNNCKWATRKEQGNNRRTNRTLMYNGKTKTIVQWAAITGLNTTTIRERLQRGWSDAKTLSVKVGKISKPLPHFYFHPKNVRQRRRDKAQLTRGAIHAIKVR